MDPSKEDSSRPHPTVGGTTARVPGCRLARGITAHGEVGSCRSVCETRDARRARAGQDYRLRAPSRITRTRRTASRPSAASATTTRGRRRARRARRDARAGPDPGRARARSPRSFQELRAASPCFLSWPSVRARIQVARGKIKRTFDGPGDSSTSPRRTLHDRAAQIALGARGLLHPPARNCRPGRRVLRLGWIPPAPDTGDVD